MSCNRSFEELARFSAGDLPTSEAEEVAKHLSTCPNCQRKMAALDVVDEAFARWQPHEIPAGTLLSARRFLSDAMGIRQEQEILTLSEVAKLLRVGPDEMKDIIETIPAFEIAGRLRVRKAKLMEWVQEKEGSYSRANIQSNVSRILSGRFRREIAHG